MSSDVQYGGHWKVPGVDETIDGTLHYSEENRVLLLQLIKPFDLSTFDSHIIESMRVPVICGTLFTGSHVALLNCFRTNTHTRMGSHTTELVYADYALWGLAEADCNSPTFRGAAIDYGSIVEWAGLSRYDLDAGGKPLGETITWSHKDRIELDAAQGLRLRFAPQQGSFTPTYYDNDVTVHQYVSTRFFYDVPKSWEDIMDDANWLRRMVELGKGCSVSIREAKYLHQSHLLPEKYGAKGPDRYEPASVLLGTEQKEVNTGRSRRWTFLFDLAEAAGCGAIDLWFARREDLEPVVDLYTLAYTDTIPSAMALFLNLMQALETYHARFVCGNAKDYKKRVKQLVAASGSDPSLQDFLCDEGQEGSKSLYLKSRISDLLYAEGKRPVVPRRIDFKDFPQKLVDTRNYYTHYSKDKKDKAFDKDELPTVNAELMALLEYHLMLTLGFDAGGAAEKVGHRLKDRIG